MAKPLSPCLICKSRAVTAREEGQVLVKCRRCGTFTITDLAARALSELTPQRMANLSGWLRENEGCIVTDERLKELLQLRSPTVGEKGDKLLLFLASRFPKPGGDFHIDFDENGSGDSEALRGRYVHAEELLAAAWAQDHRELRFVLEGYLTGEKGALSFESSGFTKGFHTITPKGWSQVAALRHSDIKSDRGFVAMWFDHSMDAADVAIGAAIREAGYRALRLDRYEHNNQIDDEILAAIRRSKFVVADLTGQRGVFILRLVSRWGLAFPSSGCAGRMIWPESISTTGSTTSSCGRRPGSTL